MESIGLGYTMIDKREDHPLSIIVTQDDSQGLIDAINHFHHNLRTEQFIIFTTPSFITHLLTEIGTLKIEEPFSVHKLKFCVIGEVFDEEIREKVDAICSPDKNDVSMLSIYATPDTTIIGTESLAAALRKIFLHNKPFAETLGFGDDLPHFFHFTTQEAYIEAVEKELCITQ